jgi:hypothetical protein
MSAAALDTRTIMQQITKTQNHWVVKWRDLASLYRQLQWIIETQWSQIAAEHKALITGLIVTPDSFIKTNWQLLPQSIIGVLRAIWAHSQQDQEFYEFVAAWIEFRRVALNALEQDNSLFQTELALEIPKALEEAKTAPSMNFEEFNEWLGTVEARPAREVSRKSS